MSIILNYQMVLPRTEIPSETEILFIEFCLSLHPDVVRFAFAVEVVPKRITQTHGENYGNYHLFKQSWPLISHVIHGKLLLE